MATTQPISPTRPTLPNSSTNATSLAPTPSAVRIALQLPLPVPSSTHATTSLLSIRFKARRVLKVVIGTLLGFLGVTATWWALDLAMWTAVKEWRDDCREQKEHGGRSTKECSEMLTQELSPPPTWRSFLQKLPQVNTALDSRPYKIESPPREINHDEELKAPERRDDAFDDEDIDMYGESDVPIWDPMASMDTRYLSKGSHAQGSRPRETLASRTPQRGSEERAIGVYMEILPCEELHRKADRARTCANILQHFSPDKEVAGREVRKQGDAAIMYESEEQQLNLTFNPEILRDFFFDKDLVTVWNNYTTSVSRSAGQIQCIAKSTSFDDYDFLYDPSLTYPQHWQWSISCLEQDELDWHILRDHQHWQYGDKMSLSCSQERSFQSMSVHLNIRRTDFWRRIGWCDARPPNMELAAGQWSFFESPEWIHWETMSWWVLSMVLLVLYETVGGGRRRRREDACAREKGKGEKEKIS